MRRVLERFTSPLRKIDAYPDDLVVEAFRLLDQIPKHPDNWLATTALSSEATARIQLANYLREYRS
ncbi:hypothetical protein [Streptomyces decoyicus]|uniref:hypothetical protein n=1 Tax=Streptomyces decoyicus TaxID=249567 RepID=UPI003667055D